MVLFKSIHMLELFCAENRYVTPMQRKTWLLAQAKWVYGWCPWPQYMIYLCQSSGKWAGGTGGCWCGSSCCSQPPICQAAGTGASSWAHCSSPMALCSCSSPSQNLTHGAAKFNFVCVPERSWASSGNLSEQLEKKQKTWGSKAAGHCKSSHSPFLLVVLNCKFSV